MQRYLNQSREVLSIFINHVERNKGRKEIRQAVVTEKRQSRKVGSFQTLCFLTQYLKASTLDFFFPPFKLPSMLHISNSLCSRFYLVKASTFFFFPPFKLPSTLHISNSLSLSLDSHFYLVTQKSLNASPFFFLFFFFSFFQTGLNV